MRGKSGKVAQAGIDGAIAEVARRQYGVISRAQLLDLGLGAKAIEYRVRIGRLHPIHPGVYLLGHSVPPPLAHEIAAVHACGRERTFLSHESAARIWHYIPLSSPNAPIMVTVIGAAPKLRGIRAHRVSALEPPDRLIKKRLPIISPARTLLDMAGCVDEEELERMVAFALRRHLVSHTKLREVLERYPRRKGSALTASQSR